MSMSQVELLARGAWVREGRLLVCRTGKAPIVYLPGGHVEFGETARRALEREIQEELGCDASAGRFLGAIQHTFIQKNVRHWEINLVFEMTVDGVPLDRPPQAVEKHLSFEWVDLNALTQAHLEPSKLAVELPAWLNDPATQHWIEPDQA